MKDYKRLTERDEFGNADIIGLGSEILASNLDFDGLNKLTFALNKFADLEDKIESGEIDYVADKDKAIACLTDENDKLRSRLKNAVELPTMGEFKIVDLHTNFYQIAYAVLYKSNGKLYIYQCFDKAKAEAKLKEVGGGENDNNN